MELWIRSQDKTTLIKANALYVMDNQIWNEVPFYENHKKIGLTITGHNHRLAQYKSKERALEILDEIQNAILCSSASPEELKELKIEFKSWYATNIKTGVAIYQMPEE